MKSIRLFTAACAAFVASSLSALAGDPSGTWTFKAEGTGGKSVESTLVLQWDQHRLTGNIDNRAGKAEISKATFVDDQVEFTVVRKLGRGLRKREIVVNYAGKLEGDTIQGTIQTTGRQDQPVTIPWTAQRAN